MVQTLKFWIHFCWLAFPWSQPPEASCCLFSHSWCTRFSYHVQSCFTLDFKQEFDRQAVAEKSGAASHPHRMSKLPYVFSADTALFASRDLLSGLLEGASWVSHWRVEPKNRWCPGRWFKLRLSLMYRLSLLGVFHGMALVSHSSIRAELQHLSGRGPKSYLQWRLGASRFREQYKTDNYCEEVNFFLKWLEQISRFLVLGPWNWIWMFGQFTDGQTGVTSLLVGEHNNLGKHLHPLKIISLHHYAGPLFMHAV